MIDIVLPAYNGERYLPDQLDSLLNQTEKDWRLIAMDDGSADGTAAVLLRYAEDCPDKITLLPAGPPSGSAAAAFLRLIAQTQAPYVMCCDQDDVWHADKLAITLAKMHELEQQYGPDAPLLVHTDLAVTDAELTLIAPSFVRYQRLRPKIKALNRLLVQNNVTGCTVMINAALRKLLPSVVLPGLVMHDWWMALTAAAFGEIGYIDVATLFYRQHGTNAVGAKEMRDYGSQILSGAGSARQSLSHGYVQAEAFLSYYRTRLPEKALRQVAEYAEIPRLGKVARVQRLLRCGFLKHDLRRMLGQFYFI